MLPIAFVYQVMHVYWHVSKPFLKTADAADVLKAHEAAFALHMPAFRALCCDLQTSIAYCAASRFARIVSYSAVAFS